MFRRIKFVSAPADGPPTAASRPLAGEFTPMGAAKAPTRWAKSAYAK